MTVFRIVGKPAPRLLPRYLRTSSLRRRGPKFPKRSGEREISHSATHTKHQRTKPFNKAL